MYGTAAGGFMCIIVRLIARPFTSWSDTTPASNVSGTHSYLAAVRRTDQIPLWHLPEIFMTLQKAKSIARHLGLTLRQLRSGNYRVNFRDGNETTAYYTDNFEDAVNSAIEMTRRRAFSSDYRADGAGGDRARCVMTEDIPRSGRDEQMFGANQQIRHAGQSD